MSQPPETTEPSLIDPTTLADAELEAVAAGKQRMGEFMGDVIFTAPMVKAGLLPRSALKDRKFGRWNV